MSASWVRHGSGLAHIITATGSDAAVTACGRRLPKPLTRVKINKRGEVVGNYTCPDCQQRKETK